MGLSKYFKRTSKAHTPLYSSPSEGGVLYAIVLPTAGGVSLSALILADEFNFIDVEIEPIHYFFYSSLFCYSSICVV